MKTIKLSQNKIKKIIKETIKRCINETYSLTDNDELSEFLWLRPNVTGLRVDIFVDDGGSYLRNNHRLLLFARNGYNKSVNEFISFAVSKNPIILNPEIEYKITYNDIFAIQDFITNNLSGLRNLADKKIKQLTFVNNIRFGSYGINENASLICEMATLSAEDSKLPMDIWLDEGATYIGHAPRIKFRACKDQRTTREFSSMLLTNPPTIENFPKNSPLKRNDIEKLKNFVIENLDLLLQLANGEIEYLTEFLPKMKTNQ